MFGLLDQGDNAFVHLFMIVMRDEERWFLASFELQHGQVFIIA